MQKLISQEVIEYIQTSFNLDEGPDLLEELASRSQKFTKFKKEEDVSNDVVKSRVTAGQCLCSAFQ